jgi:hypothetical protein
VFNQKIQYLTTSIKQCIEFRPQKFKSLESYINYDRVNKTKHTQTAGARRLFVVSPIYLPAELVTQKNVILFSDAKAEVIPVPKKGPCHEGVQIHAFFTSALDLGRIPAPASLAGCLFIGVGGPRTGKGVSR